MIIGVVDTGISAEHPSFSDRVGVGRERPGRASSATSRSRAGTASACPGEGFNASDCNQKLIGAQYFYAGFGIEDIAERDFLSPRDYNGHGSHTASTAGGNNGIQATGDAPAFGKISGMAPRARIAAYKVCWEDSGDGGCANSDSVAAIDQAVADGVDVINFSISGTRTNYLDAVEVAFLFAADAGVFVADVGRQRGAGDFTVAHPSPWLSRSRPSTHNRTGLGTVTLGTASRTTGRTVAANAVTGPAILASAAGLAGANADEVRLCFLGALDPAKVAGKIVVLRPRRQRPDRQEPRGQAAGGLGMIMANTSANSVNADLHFVPSIHVRPHDRATIRTYLGANPNATGDDLEGHGRRSTSRRRSIAAFSSRGPSLAGIGGEDIMKPDFMAPGEDILAAVAPEGNHGRT